MTSANKEAKKRLKQLRELVTYHRTKYHTEDKPEISDEAYDALVKELTQLELELEESLSQVVEMVGGAPGEAFAKVRHQVPQWSFDNVFSAEELEDWENRLLRVLQKSGIEEPKLTYVTEHKIDGLKLVLEYRGGLLVKAATRGDGEVGEDVTHTALTIASLPHKLKEAIDLICVGEVWLGQKEFEALNQKQFANGESLFANPRNAAAGSLRQLDPAIARGRKLSLYVYDIDYLDGKKTKVERPMTQWEELKLLKKLGFPVNAEAKLCQSLTDIDVYYQKWRDQHHDLPYGVDVVVIKLNDVELQVIAGYTAKSPRFGVAYKFPAVETTTVVEAIELQVGRTGVVTPVAHLKPVAIDGSTVARATLHNEDQINRLDVRVGDTIILRKAGDVIPEVVAVIKELRPEKSRAFRFPRLVEGCGGAGEIMRVAGTSAYRCVSLDSDFLHRQRLYYFVSKNALNIDGVGPKIIDALLTANLIKDEADLFELTIDDFLQLPGFKLKSATNAVEAIRLAKQTTWSRLLVGLSIENVGEETARLLVKHFPTPKDLQEAKLREVENIYGIGEVIASTIVDWQKNQEAQSLFRKLLTHIAFAPEITATAGGKLEGQSVIFTGTLDGLTRSEAETIAKQAGATIVGAVSKKTSFVVAGADPGSKVAKAQKLGVPILTKEQFLKRVAG